MPRLKGGYKNVSLKNIDIARNESIDGLYAKLNETYGKPVQLCGIVIDNVKFKNAFVQVSKDVNSEKIIIENLYGYKIVVDADDSFEVGRAIPEELPDTSEASEGDVLKLNAQKKPEWGVIPEELPDTSEASEGDVLKLNAQKKPEWGAGASGGTKLYKHIINVQGQAPLNNIVLVSTDATPFPTSPSGYSEVSALLEKIVSTVEPLKKSSDLWYFCKLEWSWGSQKLVIDAMPLDTTQSVITMNYDSQGSDTVTEL